MFLWEPISLSVGTGTFFARHQFSASVLGGLGGLAGFDCFGRFVVLFVRVGMAFIEARFCLIHLDAPSPLHIEMCVVWCVVFLVISFMFVSVCGFGCDFFQNFIIFSEMSVSCVWGGLVFGGLCHVNVRFIHRAMVAFRVDKALRGGVTLLFVFKLSNECVGVRWVCAVTCVSVVFGLSGRTVGQINQCSRNVAGGYLMSAVGNHFGGIGHHGCWRLVCKCGVGVEWNFDLPGG